MASSRNPDWAGDQSETLLQPTNARSLPPNIHREATQRGWLEGGWDAEGKGGFFGSASNMANSAIGAGVLAFPYAFSNSGIALGSILTVVFYLLTCFSLHHVGLAQRSTRTGSYQQIVKSLLGDGIKGEKGIIIAQLMFLVGACIAYLIIVADQLSPFFAPSSSSPLNSTDSSFWSVEDTFGASNSTTSAPTPASAGDPPEWARIVIIGGVSLFVCLPLCFIKTISKLAPMATFSMMSIAFMCVAVTSLSAIRLKDHGFPRFDVFGSTSKASWFVVEPQDFFQSIPLISFAFMAHPTYPIVFKELKDRRLKTMDNITAVAFFVCLVIYVVVGAAGNLYAVSINYRDPKSGEAATPDDILQAWSAPNQVQLSHGMDNVNAGGAPLLVVLMRVCIAISVVSSFVSLHFSARLCLQDLLTGEVGFTSRGWNMETVLYVVFCTVLAILIPSISAVLSYTGATAVSAMILIFPALLMRARNLRPERLSRLRTPCARKWHTVYLPVLLFTFGVCLMAACIVITTLGLIDGKS